MTKQDEPDESPTRSDPESTDEPPENPSFDNLNEQARRRQARAHRDRSIGDLAGRFLRAGAEAVASTSDRIRERGEDLPRGIVREAAGLGARGKDEVMTLLANEVRSYLQKLRVGEELERFLTTHSLEVSGSISLKPLADVITKSEPEPEPPADAPEHQTDEDEE